MDFRFDIHLASPGLTVAIAMAAGMLAQSLAYHVRLPGIVVLLFTGVLLGPDVADVVRPSLLGPGLLTLVGFAVAVILFEGGLNLEIRRLRRAQRAIRNLVTVGALITALGGAAVARLVMGWSYRLCFLFGTLVIVTGPTVVTPLLKRLRVHKRVATVLEAEGVLIDAIGAVTAAVAIEMMLRPSGENVAVGPLYVAMRLAAGVITGALGGALIAMLLRVRKVIPPGLENVLTLGLALLVFEGSNALMPESGIAAVTVAGIVVGNSRSFIHRDLAEFKEQLTVLLIGMLFVLLAADVRISEVIGLGWRGVLAVAALMFIVRPMTVAASTVGTALDTRERIFVAWIAPRGIVAAAVASLFSLRLEAEGVAGGAALRALVFLVITVTVIWAGLTGGLAARALGLRRESGVGWVVLGADPFARTVARLLADGEVPVLCIDRNADHVRAAEEDGLRVLLGNALEERTLLRAELETRRGALAITGNEEVNALFAEKGRREARELPFVVTLHTWGSGITFDMLAAQGIAVAFGASVDVPTWSSRLERGHASLEWWRRTTAARAMDALTGADANPPFVVLARRARKQLEPVDHTMRFGKGDEVAVLLDDERRAQAEARLAELGWTPLEGEARTIVLGSDPAGSSATSHPGSRVAPERKARA